MENVVETLAGMRHEGVELYMTAGSIPHRHEQCRQYLATNPKLRDVPLIGMDHPWIVRQIMKTKMEVLARHPKYTLWHRIVRRFYYILDHLYLKDDKHVLNTKFLAQMDVYHSVFAPAPESVRALRNVAVVQTVHDLIPILFPEYCTPASIEHLNRVLDTIDERVIAISNSENTKRDLLAQKGMDPASVHVTALAASDSFQPCTDETLRRQVRDRLSILEGAYILSLATLEPRKNIVSVIRAFDRMITEHGFEGLSLVLAGTKGWNYDEIFEQLHTNPETGKHVVVTGYVDESDLAPLYSGASMFVYPSHYEGFGLPPLEAMKCGVPVITSDNSSLPEVVGDAALLVDANDVDAIADAMHRIQTDSVLRERLSADSIKQAARFNWERCALLTRQAYEEAVRSNLLRLKI